MRLVSHDIRSIEVSLARARQLQNVQILLLKKKNKKKKLTTTPRNEKFYVYNGKLQPHAFSKAIFHCLYIELPYLDFLFPIDFTPLERN